MAWLFNESQIARIAGVACKPFDEDKHDHLLSLDPEYWDSTPPITYVEIIWKDGKRTFETRTSIRRLLGNPRGGGPDLAILHRAKVQEKRYANAQLARGSVIKISK